MVEQCRVHRRDARERGDLVALDDLERLARLEARQQCEERAPRITMFITEVSPKTWNSGSVPRLTKSGPASTRSRATSAPVARLLCVSVAPFGVPVVPDV
jgi:hypothetical protein